MIKILAILATLLVGLGAASAQSFPPSLQVGPGVPVNRAYSHKHFAICCDSWEQQMSTQVDLVNPQLTAANISVLNSILGLPWNIDPALDNFGQSGGDLPNFFSQWAAIKARTPDYLVIGVGHNAAIGAAQASLAAGGNTAAATAAIYAYLPTEESLFTQAAQLMLANNITPVVVLEESIDCDEISQGTNCYSSGQYGTTYLAAIQNFIRVFNVWKSQFAARNGLPVLDWWTPTIAPSGVSINSVTYMGLPTTCTDDYVHPNNYCNLLMAKSNAVSMAALSGPSIAPLPSTTLDLNTTANSNGNYLGNGVFLNGTYPYTTSPFAGNWANNWNGLSATVGTGKVLTGSVAAAASGIGDAQTVTVSGTGTANNTNAESFYVFSQLLTNGATWTPSAATTVACYGVITVAANSPFSQVYLQLQTSAGLISTGNNWGGTAGIVSGVNQPGPSFSTATTYTVRTPPLTVPSGSTAALTVQAKWSDTAGTFTGSFSVSQVGCYPEPGPY